MTSHAIVRFLQRDGALLTWFYERRVILPIEALCLMAGVWAAPTRAAALLLLVTSPLALWATELARADRSGAARKAELAAALAIPKVKLTCERDLEQVAKNKQFVTATAPIVSLAMSVAGAGGAGLTKAAITGFAVSVIRWTVIEAYGAWRAWYRSHVPAVADVATTAEPERTSS
jgi:hypothetical protein